VDQQANGSPPPEPKDAREPTAEQREIQEQLEHQNDDPEAPGRHQTRDQLPDESTR
jgi:hypothetical protein